MPKVKSREQYISDPSPIETELKTLFGRDDALVIFDIGSCEGEDSIRYSKLFPHARIYAVEPLQKNIERIRSLVEKYAVDNVEIVPLALSDQSGKATFYVSSGQREDYSPNQDWDFGNKSSSLLPPEESINNIFPWLQFNETIEVDTATLKNVCTQKGLDHIDFIHMDVQGAEYQVLLGAGELIQSIALIWLEVSNKSMYKNQPLKAQIEQFMEQNGFLMLKDTGGDAVGDQLYFNKRYFNKPFPMRHVLYLRMRSDLRNLAVRIVPSALLRRLRS